MAQLYFYYSAMNAGKSTSLLQSAYNYQERGMNPVLYTAKIDNRFGAGKIASRIGLEMPAFTFGGGTDLFNDVIMMNEHNSVDCILIDEAQFLNKGQVDQLCKIVDELDIPVLCYGLRTDFRGESFEGSAALLAVADKLVELKTVCPCGRKATMQIRLLDGKSVFKGDQIQIGGNESYVSVCRKHFNRERNSMAG